MEKFRLLCRVCLADNANIQLFTKTEGPHHISSKLSLCLHEKIEDIEGYPKNICISCYDLINTLYNFQQKYKESCHILNECFMEIVKSEESLDNAFDDSIYEENIDFPKDVRDLKIEMIGSVDDELNTSKSGEVSKLRNKSCINIGNTTIKKIRQPVRKQPRKKPDFEPKVIENDILEKRLTKKIQNTMNNPGRLCDSCGELFDSADKLLRHKATFHANASFVCNQCEKKFKLKEYLNAHIKRKHGKKNFKCPNCERYFAFEGELRTHIKVVHNKSRLRIILVPCKYCKKMIRRGRDHLLHERIHTGEKPEKCSVCDAAFSVRAYLREHMRLHTGDTPFKCPICGKGFAQSCNMKSHVKHNHWLKDVDREILGSLRPSIKKLLKT